MQQGPLRRGEDDCEVVINDAIVLEVVDINR